MNKTYKIEGYEITKPIKCKTYQDAEKNCPKGFRLPKRWELFKIFENMKNRKKLSNGEYMFFWSSIIENNYCKGLYLYRYLIVFSYNDILVNSFSYGQVIYVKENKK